MGTHVTPAVPVAVAVGGIASTHLAAIPAGPGHQVLAAAAGRVGGRAPVVTLITACVVAAVITGHVHAVLSTAVGRVVVGPVVGLPLGVDDRVAVRAVGLIGVVTAIVIGVVLLQGVALPVGVQLLAAVPAVLDAVVVRRRVVFILVGAPVVGAGRLAAVVVAADGTFPVTAELMSAIKSILEALILGDAARAVDIIVAGAVGTHPAPLVAPVGLLIKVQGQPSPAGDAVVGAVPVGRGIAEDSRVGYGCHGQIHGQHQNAGQQFIYFPHNNLLWLLCSRNSEHHRCGSDGVRLLLRGHLGVILDGKASARRDRRESTRFQRQGALPSGGAAVQRERDGSPTAGKIRIIANGILRGKDRYAGDSNTPGLGLVGDGRIGGRDHIPVHQGHRQCGRDGNGNLPLRIDHRQCHRHLMALHLCCGGKGQQGNRYSQGHGGR